PALRPQGACAGDASGFERGPGVVVEASGLVDEPVAAFQDALAEFVPGRDRLLQAGRSAVAQTDDAVEREIEFDAEVAVLERRLLEQDRLGLHGRRAAQK